MAKIKLFGIITCDTVIRYLWWGFVEMILCCARKADLPVRPLMTLVLIKLNKIRFDMEQYQRARILIG